MVLYVPRSTYLPSYRKEVLCKGWESFSIFEILNPYVARNLPGAQEVLGDEMPCIEFVLSLVQEDQWVPHEGHVSKLDQSGSLEQVSRARKRPHLFETHQRSRANLTRDLTRDNFDT